MRHLLTRHNFQVSLTQPVFSSNAIYGSTLSDARFWSPYARAALDRSGFDLVPLECGFVGTYPTLVGGTIVVKLFGHFGDWRRSFTTELTANRAIAADRRIRAAPVLASGRLFSGTEADWPYLIMARLPGVAWRETVLPARTQRRLAWCLGAQLRAVHDTQVSDAAPLHPDWLADQAQNTTRRHRDWGSLPPRLIDQIDEFLNDYRRAATCLVHGDVTEDHIFVDRNEISGLIDWGDAMITDPFTIWERCIWAPSGATSRCFGDSPTGTGGRWRVALSATPCRWHSCTSSTYSPGSLTKSRPPRA